MSREIDVLIAEKIFNWEWSNIRERKFLSPPLTDEISNWTGMWNEKGIPHYLPHYSTNISDAWEIVEKMRKDNDYWFELTTDKSFSLDYRCYFQLDDNEFEAIASTAPMSICLVALESVGVDINDL